MGRRKNITNANTKYIQFDFRRTLSDFYQLRHTMMEPHTEYVRRYAITRIVTLIEQFLREIVVFNLMDGKEIKQKNIILFKSLIISAIKQQEQTEPGDTSDSIWKNVKGFIDKHSKDGASYDCETERATIPIKLLKDLIKSCSKHPVYVLRYRLIAASLSFQNTWQINNILVEFGILANEDRLTGKTKVAFDKLFEARHVLIHSIGDTDLNVRVYFLLAETLFQNILEKIRPNQACFDFAKGKALNNNGQHEEAIKCLSTAVKYQYHDPQIFIHLGTSLLALGRKEEANERFREALSVAVALGMKVRKSNANGENIESAENTLHDAALSCLWIGDIACDLKDHTFAYEAFMAAFGNNPGSLKLCHWIGKDFALIKDYDMACVCYQDLIEKYPDDTNGHEQLGHMFNLTGKEDRAQKEFKTAKHLRQNQEPPT